MRRARFGVGDLVTHNATGDEIFVVEHCSEPLDDNIEPVYQCSSVSRYELGWHGYPQDALTRAVGVPQDRKPNAIKRASMILGRVLKAAEDGGMRHRRAEQLHEEFCDHWLQNGGPEKMTLLSDTLNQIEELLRKTRSGS
jgi:hypothetical protein